MDKKIIFLTSTRADFSHQKVLIDKCVESDGFSPFIFVTGTHMNKEYGETVQEVNKCNYDNVFYFLNYEKGDTMDIVLSKTIAGFSDCVKKTNPDLIVVFADRFEAMAGAIVGSFNNILTVHVQSGDISGTIDNSIRHAISKLCHSHMVSSRNSFNRLSSMGEVSDHIWYIGTPGLDSILDNNFDNIYSVKHKHNITFDDYSIFVFHPVTTELEMIEEQIHNAIEAIIESSRNYIIIDPNCDMGSYLIRDYYAKIKYPDNIKIFKSFSHKDFLTLLKYSNFIIGNSSAGIIEAPFMGVPSINIGSRQDGRSLSDSILNCDCKKDDILKAIDKMFDAKFEKSYSYGYGDSGERFIDILRDEEFWEIRKQKKYEFKNNSKRASV